MTTTHHTEAADAHLGGAVRRTELACGLRVVSEDVPGSHTFSIGFFVGVGSRHEADQLHGASHFLEHVLFKGTRRRAPEEISAAIEQVGGDLNAYTGKEQTCFYARVLAEDAGLATDVLLDMLTGSLVLGEDLEAEREVILEEIAMHADEAGEVAADLVAARLFHGHTLGRSIIGSPGSVGALTREQVVGFWRRHYRPSSLVVAASGRVDHEALVRQLAPLDAVRQPHRARRSSPPARRHVPGVELVPRPTEQCTVSMAFPGFGLFDERRFPLGVLGTVLGGGMSSRLFVEVRERRGLTYSIDAGETTYSDAGVFTVDWQCTPDRVEPVAVLVREALAEVVHHEVPAAELARARGQLRGQTVLAYESPAARMSRLGSSELSGDPRTLTEVLAGYDAVTAEDVRRVARDVVTAPPLLAVVGPAPGRERLERLVQGWAEALSRPPAGRTDDDEETT
ncbi:M16 family metallopeptidase [Auraticoccus monumenti]|uniref:Predicted Zn-dependent peptidase n=1 Tax=Auraticoccus monumenti TaxID=675864 RepID=A0A1G7D7M3_9ACTN|nr:pitrilysin family protein [Auraticoccus monumenti]SDE47562.1 Predicted Zn-dependent peptidase [Auraticoccus monumenti]